MQWDSARHPCSACTARKKFYRGALKKRESVRITCTRPPSHSSAEALMAIARGAAWLKNHIFRSCTTLRECPESWLHLCLPASASCGPPACTDTLCLLMKVLGTGGHHCWVCCNCGLDKTSWGCENYSKKACRQCKKVSCRRERVRTTSFSVAKLLDA